MDFPKVLGFCPPQAEFFLKPLKLATHLLITWPPGEKTSFPLKLAGQLKWVTTVVKNFAAFGGVSIVNLI